MIAAKEGIALQLTATFPSGTHDQYCSYQTMCCLQLPVELSLVLFGVCWPRHYTGWKMGSWMLNTPSLLFPSIIGPFSYREEEEELFLGKKENLKPVLESIRIFWKQFFYKYSGKSTGLLPVANRALCSCRSSGEPTDSRGVPDGLHPHHVFSISWEI